MSGDDYSKWRDPLEMRGLPAENTDEEAPVSRVALLAGHGSEYGMADRYNDEWGADVRRERRMIVVSGTWICCIALPIVTLTLVLGWGMKVESPNIVLCVLVLVEILAWLVCIAMPVVGFSRRYLGPRGIPRKLTMEVSILMLIACAAWVCSVGLPFFALTILGGWGMSPQPERLAALATELEAAAAEGAYVASTCRYLQYNDGPEFLGRHGLHLLRTQPQGHMTQVPNLLYLLHHAGAIFELARSDGSPYRFLKVDFSERGLETLWRNETPPHYHDIIPWADNCLLWCGQIPKSHSSPSTLIASLMSTRGMYYNWYFFNCAHYVTFLWKGMQPIDEGCGPPMSWPVPGIPFTTASQSIVGTSAHRSDKVDRSATHLPPGAAPPPKVGLKSKVAPPISAVTLVAPAPVLHEGSNNST